MNGLLKNFGSLYLFILSAILVSVISDFIRQL